VELQWKSVRISGIEIDHHPFGRSRVACDEHLEFQSTDVRRTPE